MAAITPTKVSRRRSGRWGCSAGVGLAGSVNCRASSDSGTARALIGRTYLARPRILGFSVLPTQCAHIVSQRSTGRIAVSRLETAMQALMLSCDLATVAEPKDHHVDRRLQRLDYAGRCKVERRVPRRFDERTMETHVGCAEVFIGQRRVTLLLNLTRHCRQLLIGTVECRKPATNEFNLLPRLREVAEREGAHGHEQPRRIGHHQAGLLSTGLIDEGAPGRTAPRSNQVLSGQPLQRFANRRTRYVELGGKFLLCRQSLVDLYSALHDCVANLFGDLPGQALRYKTLIVDCHKL